MINDGAESTDYGALETDPALSFSAISFLKPHWILGDAGTQVNEPLNGKKMVATRWKGKKERVR